MRPDYVAPRYSPIEVRGMRKLASEYNDADLKQILHKLNMFGYESWRGIPSCVLFDEWYNRFQENAESRPDPDGCSC